MNTQSNIYQLQYTNVRAYLLATLFIIGNIVAPQICHLIPRGGFIFLPIYFFTLIAAYRYGIVTGIVTAICSPVINHLLFGMPPAAVLPILLVKSILLAIIASWMASRIGKVTFVGVFLSVIGYQLAGFLFEWPMTSSITVALQDVRIGFPGIILQIGLGYLLLKKL